MVTREAKKCFINLNEIFIRTKLKQRSTHTHLLSSDTASYSNHQFLILREGGVGRLGEGGRRRRVRRGGTIFFLHHRHLSEAPIKYPAKNISEDLSPAQRKYIFGRIFFPLPLSPYPLLGTISPNKGCVWTLLKAAIALADLHVFLAHGKGYKAHKLGIFCPPSNKVINKFYNRWSSLKHIVRWI